MRFNLSSFLQLPLPFFTHLFDTAIGTEYVADDVDGDRLGDVTIIHGGDSASVTEGTGESDDEVGKLKVIGDKRKASLQLGSAKKGVKMRLLQGMGVIDVYGC